MKKGLRRTIRFNNPPSFRNTDRPDEEGIKTKKLFNISCFFFETQTDLMKKGLRLLASSKPTWYRETQTDLMKKGLRPKSNLLVRRV